MKFHVRLERWPLSDGCAQAVVELPLSGRTYPIGPRFLHREHGHAGAYDEACIWINKVKPKKYFRQGLDKRP